MAAAGELIGEQGYDAVRLRDVGRAAGVSIGMIQHYFGSRDELLQETLSSASRERVRSWTDSGNRHSDPGRRLGALLDQAVADDHRCLMWIQTCAAASRHPQLRPDVVLTQNAWREGLNAVITDGVAHQTWTPQLTVAQIVDVLVPTIDGLMLEAATGSAAEKNGGRPHRSEVLRNVASSLLRVTSL